MLAVEKSAQLTEVYRRLLEANGSDERRRRGGPRQRHAQSLVSRMPASPPVNRMSSWQAAAADARHHPDGRHRSRVAGREVDAAASDEFAVPLFGRVAARADWRGL